MNVEDDVNSPSFSIINEYHTKEDDIIFHFDFYRLKSIEEALDIGYEEYIYSGNYCFMEWPEKIDQISLDEVCGVTVFTTQPVWELQFGWVGYGQRLVHWRQVLEKLGERSRQVSYFDCVESEIVVAGLGPQKQAGSHRKDLKVGK